MRKIYYYCTCKKEAKGNGAEGFREVQTCIEGICLDCGHYAMALPRKAKDRMEMYSILRIDKKEEDNHYIGETIISTIIENHGKVEEKKGKINNRIL